MKMLQSSWKFKSFTLTLKLSHVMVIESFKSAFLNMAVLICMFYGLFFRKKKNFVYPSMSFKGILFIYLDVLFSLPK